MKKTLREFPLEDIQNPSSEVKQSLQWYKDVFGFVPNLGKLLANAPATLVSYVDTQKYLDTIGTLSSEENNIVQMTIAIENQCQYCVGGHTMAGEMLFGNKAEDIEALRNKVSLSSDKFNALQAFTKTLYKTKGRVSDKELDAFFNAGYTKPQALDVITNISAKVISNFANQLAINIPDEPFAKLSETLNYDSSNYR